METHPATSNTLVEALKQKEMSSLEALKHAKTGGAR